MLFTTPIFLFFFLPVCVLFYAAVGKNKKRLSIFVFSVLFHLLFNLNHPQNLLYLAGLFGFTFFAGKLAKKFGKTFVTAFFAAIPFVLLVLFKNLFPISLHNLVYPFGITFQVFAAVSYIIEAGRSKTAEKMRALDLLFYLCFFPTLFAGPIIRYPKFISLLKEENINFDMKNASLGARVFMIGFIKRVAVGAVFTEGFVKLFELDRGSPNLFVAFTMLVLVHFAIYFSFSGYSDMGVGIARIFGVRLGTDSRPPFGAPTPAAYFNGFFKSLRGFIDEYFLLPIRKITKGKRLFLVESAVVTLTVFLMLRATPFSALVAVPTIIFMYLTEKFRIKSRLAKKKGIHAMFALANAFIVTISLLIIIVDNNDLVASYLRQLTVFSSEYKFDLILIAISRTKLLFVAAVMIFTCIPTRKVENFLAGRLSINLGGRFDYAVLLVLLLLFAFTIMFFLPQFPAYDISPFHFINL